MELCQEVRTVTDLRLLTVSIGQSNEPLSVIQMPLEIPHLQSVYLEVVIFTCIYTLTYVYIKEVRSQSF